MHVISITGGKGGVGKTTLSVNLAVAFSKMKKKVLLLDGDLGLANVDVLLGLTPNKTLHDVLLGSCNLNDICMTGPHNMRVIPGASGIQQMADLNSKDSLALIQQFSDFVENIDVMIVDIASGVSGQVIDFTNASQDIVISICNDPSSLVDSYAVLKILYQRYSRKRFGVLVNKVKNNQEGEFVFERFQEATRRFIDVNINYLGSIPQDDYIAMAACERVCVVDKYPKSPASLAINQISRNIDFWCGEENVSGGVQFFFERLVGLV